MLALATPARHSRARLRWVTPIAALVAVSVISLAARVAFLGSPCHEPCTSASAHVLVFDESYYVNAARVIAGVEPPPGAHYRDTPPGDDPNAEHPQLAKVVIAGAIELFGDGPLAWRLPAASCSARWRSWECSRWCVPRAAAPGWRWAPRR